VLDWASFERTAPSTINGVEQAPYRALTTSGRAAIYQALLQLQLPAGSTVLVPTYHCPTMVAPVLYAGLEPAFFGVGTDGLPNLQTVTPELARRAKAIVVAHYFGIPHSLRTIREWCDVRGIALIEDCAHCFFGQAGERRVGQWGDFATASLSKFFPVPEAGLLTSAHRPIDSMKLKEPGLRAQLKGWVDVVEFATDHNRLGGVNGLFTLVFRWKNRGGRRSRVVATPEVSAEEGILEACDMARVGHSPLNVSRVLNRLLPRGRVASRRRDNFAAYTRHFRDVPGARIAVEMTPGATAPYVFPLWVDDSERVYREAREMRLPVLRWDRIWPGTPALAGDVGPAWSEHVLQLLCHQDLSTADVDSTARALIHFIKRTPSALLATSGL
jgi:perosamine synthetase